MRYGQACPRLFSCCAETPGFPRKADNSKAENELGMTWTPLEQGIRVCGCSNFYIAEKRTNSICVSDAGPRRQFTEAGILVNDPHSINHVIS